MKRSMIASLFLVVMVATAGGSRVAPAAAAPAPPEIGSCRWICVGTEQVFSNPNTCASACFPSSCDLIC